MHGPGKSMLILPYTNMNRRLILSGFFSLAFGLAQAGDWPRWLGPFENGKTDEGLPEKIALDEIAWQKGIGIGFSSFAVGQGKVLTMGHRDGEETVWCFSLGDGNELWKHSYPAKLMPNLHEGGPNATPTIDGDRVFAISKDGQLHCYSLSDGEVLWKKNMLKESVMYRPPEWGFGGSPYLHEDWVIIESGATFAYDKSTGKEVWKSKKYRPAYGTAQRFESSGKSYLASLKTDGLVILDLSSGKTLGFHQWRTSFQTNSTTPLVAGDGKLFISTGYDRGCSLLKFDGKELTQIYESKSMSNHMGNSVLIDGHLYGFDGTAHRGRPVEFCCVDLSDGTKKWSTKELKYGTLIAAKDDLIVLSESGEMLIVEASPKGYQPRARRKILNGRCWTPPVYSNGKIFARNAAGEMVALKIK